MRCILPLLCLALALLSGCAGKYQLDMMQAPAVYQDNELDRLSVDPPARALTYPGILYATNRAPAGEDAPEDLYYDEQGDGVVRVGIAQVQFVGDDLQWEDIRLASVSENRGNDITIQVEGVTELGIIAESRHPFLPAEARLTPDANEAFAELVNNQLAHSDDQDIFIFVHGYRVPFDDPVLVATEFWHFMGYDGVAIAFSWPATPSLIAYLRDTESASNATREFRQLVHYLSEETNVHRINVLAYSAGTRMVVDALHELALEPYNTKLGQVILVSSDVSSMKIGALIADGALDKLDTFTIYTSTGDMALAFTDWLFDRRRIGGTLGKPERIPAALEFLRANPKLQLIDVTDAEGATAGNGHGYFRNSPWTSSDILASLDFHLTPEQRGLIWNDAAGEWTFPPDYLERLRAAIRKDMSDADSVTTN